MFSVTVIESTWPVVLESCSKMAVGEMISLDAVADCQSFAAEMNKVYAFLNENLPKQIFGRSFRREGDKYVEDPTGEYRSMRGMFGAVWYVRKNINQQAPGNKHIAPFD